MLKLLNEFYVGNDKCCIVQIGRNKNVSVMSEQEYNLVWGRYNHKKWGKQRRK